MLHCHFFHILHHTTYCNSNTYNVMCIAHYKVVIEEEKNTYLYINTCMCIYILILQISTGACTFETSSLKWVPPHVWGLLWGAYYLKAFTAWEHFQELGLDFLPYMYTTKMYLVSECICVISYIHTYIHTYIPIYVPQNKGLYQGKYLKISNGATPGEISTFIRYNSRASNNS